MPRVQIPITVVDRDGVAQPSQVTADATNDHYLDADPNAEVILEIVSTDGGAQTVEIVANPDLSVDGLTVNNLSIAVAAGATVYSGALRARSFKQPQDSNRIYVNPSVSTNLKFRAYRRTSS